jgi:hypothetical protein
MALYKDIETGIVLSSESVLSGDWVPVDEVSAADNLTVPELKSRLDELGVEYDSSDRKADLLALHAEHEGNE